MDLERTQPRVSVEPSVIGGLFALAIPAVVLVVLSVLGAVVHAHSVLVGGVLLVIVGGVLLGIRFELRALLRTSSLEAPTTTELLSNVLAIFAGTVLTFAATLELGVSVIVAAAVVGVVAALVTPNLAVPVYCGAFVGMTSPLLFPTYWYGLIASGIASVVFIMAQPVFHGVGGKLGTTAFVGATITVVLTTGTFQADPLPGWETILWVVCYSTIGAVVTFAIHAHSSASPVFASGVVGIAGGVALPLVYGDPGSLMAAGVFAASFAGMTAPERIPNEWWIVLTGAVVGLVVVYTTPYLGGSGGKLGTIAFASSLAVYGLLGTAHRIQIERRLEDIPRMDTT